MQINPQFLSVLASLHPAKVLKPLAQPFAFLSSAVRPMGRSEAMSEEALKQKYFLEARSRYTPRFKRVSRRKKGYTDKNRGNNLNLEI